MLQFSLVAFAALAGTSFARPPTMALQHAIRHNEVTVKGFEPVMNGRDFPDPCIIEHDDGWHAFSTQSTFDGKKLHVPKANSSDFEAWEFNGNVDAMPDLPPWVDAAEPKVWAPDVVALPNGTFILYYTAMSSVKKTHCIGFALSDKVDGPYRDSSIAPWICPVEQGGAIDPAGYTDPDGTHWVVYKIDGNSIGHGGACGNTVDPIVPTPIMLQRVQEDGHTLIGEAAEILLNGRDDGPYVEAPSLTKWGPDYVLFFSSHCYTSEKYDTEYAIATNIRGPYHRKGPILKTDSSLKAPGGLDVQINGRHAAFHADWKDGRALYITTLDRDGDKITANVIAG